MAEEKIELKTSEELGLLLAGQYQTFMQVQQNIQMLTKEIETRLQRRADAEKELNDAAK